MAKPTQEELKELFTYYPLSGLLLRKKCTCNRHKLGELVGGSRADGYCQVMVKSVKYLVHHIVWVMEYGVWPTGHIDHINREPNDNRLANLREVTPSQNNQNTGMSSRNTSGHKGVGWHAPMSMWRARIKVDRKDKHLGYFKNREAAAAAYVDAKRIYHPTAPV